MSGIEPKNVDVSLSQGVTIVWSDGRISHYAIAKLRKACPCATCNDLHGDGHRYPEPPALASPLPMFKPTGATLQSVQPVGRYALQFTFSDGHNTGIYTWDYLRELDPGPE